MPKTARALSSQPTGPTPIRDVIAKYQLTANKRLGQNYLLDTNLTDKIALSAGSLNDKFIVEVGPGPGSLTRSILSSGVKKLIAIELDQRFIPALEELKRTYQEKFDYYIMDGLEFDYGRVGESQIQIFSNLPFNTGTKFLVQWLTLPTWPPIWSKLTLLFQKEVAQRIVALPHSKTYGRLSVLAQTRAQAKIIMTIPAQAFTPVPMVNSALVQLTPKKTVLEEGIWSSLQEISRLGFQQRRKMIRTSLKPLSPDIERIIVQSGLCPKLRPEQLSVTDFVKLSTVLHSSRS